MPSGNPLLSIRELSVEYPPAAGSKTPLQAVRGVSLEIESAGIYGLVGESGSGKSSLAHAILGLVDTRVGEVRFDGKDLFVMDKAQQRTARRDIQLVFQDSQAALSPRRTVRQALLEPLDHFGIGSAGSRTSEIMDGLGAVGLDPSLADRFPQELSGGQRQRVALARALITRPRLIIADEPVSSLDASSQARIVQLIRDLRQRLAIAFLFVSHDLSVVRELADHVGVMYRGELVESGPAATVFSRPAHPYTAALLRAIPVADPDHPRPGVLEGEQVSSLTPPSGCVFHKRCPDRFDPCSAVSPAETVLTGTDAAQAANHSVRCHKWNPSEK